MPHSSSTFLSSIYFASISFETLKSSKTSLDISTFVTISNGQFVTFSIDHLHMPVWLNGCVFAYKVIVCVVESRCNHINFRYRACFEQGVPWNPDNYIVWIHSETHTWHDKNIRSSKHWSIRSLLNIILDKHFPVFYDFVDNAANFIKLFSLPSIGIIQIQIYLLHCLLLLFVFGLVICLFICFFCYQAIITPMLSIFVLIYFQLLMFV